MQAPRLKGACKNLRAEEMGEQKFRELCQLIGIWLGHIKEEAQFLEVVRPLFNLLAFKDRPEGFQCLFPPFFNFLQVPKFCASEECRKVLRAIFEKLSDLSETDLI